MVAAGRPEPAARAASAAHAAAVKCDWRAHAAAGRLTPADVALCEYAERLTRAPASCGAATVAALRAAGFDDTAIHDASQAIGYFNYINRIADCLGVDPEPEMRDLRR